MPRYVHHLEEGAVLLLQAGRSSLKIVPYHGLQAAILGRPASPIGGRNPVSFGLPSLIQKCLKKAFMHHSGGPVVLGLG